MNNYYLILICFLILQIDYIQSETTCNWNTDLTNTTCQGCVDIGCAYCSVSNGFVQGYNASDACIEISSLCASTEISSGTTYYSGLCSLNDLLNALFYVYVCLVILALCCCIGGIYICFYYTASVCGNKKNDHIYQPVYAPSHQQNIIQQQQQQEYQNQQRQYDQSYYNSQPSTAYNPPNIVYAQEVIVDNNKY